MDFFYHYQVAYYLCILGFATLLSAIAIPSILHVARARHLYDDIGHFRKQHDHGIPRLGGVAIFVSFAVTALAVSLIDKNFPIIYILIASIVLFIMGLKDDLSGVNFSTKFLVQFIVALILVVLGDIRLTSMYGVFGIYDLPLVMGSALTVIVIIMIINAFNLIDGIDGLAGVTGIMVNGIFAILFLYTKHYELAVISLILVGAIIGFLRYNISPAQIFMGDTGSLFIGLISVVMAIKFIELNKFSTPGVPQIYSAPALTVAIMVGPIFDTMRVFFVRIMSGSSPFSADRNHIHHRILRLGFNHTQTTLILAGLNLVSVAFALMFSTLGNFTLIIIIFTISMLFNWGVTFMIRSKEREGLALRNLFI
ncbi:undecaprenyl/decaprenyl-phosphate alpha-N-acetylglucosaminyl 1-phosphate transferase [Mucilaginibacter corticis]|uniref:Undecaprenyl/decaprenyl-phosphate alpha-N-acetylglucosaminyl 1-phosphate transferase n=2 Tax=Mucilaginibacter corticis TaxID=2597670 RepID=A0A556MG57_9SPHI|nr:undecaprenyl/decaprenyl-phosphate alpha-N-acetylglucosaminyl 1-phosphate transferase [Mucilaginibacter corticis]